MRILLVPARYAPHIGGVEGVAGELAARLTAAGHEVRVLTNRVPRTLPAHDQIDGVRVQRVLFLLPRWRHVPRKLDEFIGGVVFAPLTFWRAGRLLWTFKPQVVNVHYLGNQTPFMLVLRRLFQFRLVVSLHGSDVWVEAQRSRYDRWLFRRALRACAAVTCCSNALLSEVLAAVPEAPHKASAVRNGVDYAVYADAPPHARARPYVFAVGRLVERKGFDLLIDAFAPLAADFPDYDLQIAGAGDQMPLLAAQIERLGLQGRVILLGAVRNPLLASMYKGAAVNVVPSRRESFGIVALEALATGRPLVVSRAAGLEEALTGARVLWFAPGDSAALAAALRDALRADGTDSAREDGAHNQRVSRESGWDKVTERYLAVLEAAVHG